MGWRVLALGVAACGIGAAADDWDKVVLLQKVKRHIAATVKQMPDYTCLETSARYRKTSDKEQERAVDRVVLEVLNSGDKELFASPGERSFRTDSPSEIVQHGLSGTGAFALFLRTLFVSDNAQFTYRGEESYRGRKALRWDYRVPITSSGYSLRVLYAEGRVGMRGWVLVDADTFDMVHMTVAATEIPANLPLVTATQTIDYAPTRIGDRDLVLPQSGTMRLVEDTGGWSRNEVAFTHCQSFRAESTLSFTDAAPGAATSSRPPEPPRPIADGLVVEIELAGPITEQHTIGGLIEGRVAVDVRDRRRVVIPAGAAVRGRIRRLDREGYRWVVGLEFTEMETAAGTARFYAIFQPTDRDGQWDDVPPGVGFFFAKALPVPAGFRTVWKTTFPRSASR